MNKTVQIISETFVDDLYARPYVQVPFPLDKFYIEKAVNSFFKFLELAPELKCHIDLKISPLHRRGDIGFKHRDPENDIYNDSKDFFHYHPLIFEKYPDFIKGNQAVCEFLQNAYTIWKATYDVVFTILKNFEAHYPDTLSRIFDTPEPHIILRFLRYDFVKSGLYLAKPHFDAGSFTLAIAESTPGLRIGTNPNDLEMVHHEENKALFMISSNVRKIIDTPKLMPGWHDVIQTDKNQIGKTYARWAVVAFIEGHNVESLPQSETHKWPVV